MRSYLARPLTLEVVRFGLVGGVGFVVDVGLLALMTKLFGYNPFLSRAASFVAAGTVTWLLHRSFTFPSVKAMPISTGAGAQWLRFLSINGGVTAVGFGLYSALILFGRAPFCDPVVAVTVSSALAAIFNFVGAKFFVFSRND